MRDHSPVTIKNFGGLYDRGDPANCPSDHFVDASNVMFEGGDVTIRPGIGISQSVAVPLEDVRRMYNYATLEDGNTLLILTYDEAAGEGTIYHVVDAATVFLILGPISGMTDFAFAPYAGRAYLSPFSSFVNGDLLIEKGLQNEFVYVYAGDGTTARKAAGATPAGILTIANGIAGHTDAGVHVFGVVGETDSGYLSSVYAIEDFTTSANNSVSFGNVPILVGAQWIRRHIVATIRIPVYNGDNTGRTFFFIPNAIINDNVTTVLSNISFYDIELIDEAGQDNFEEIAAGAVLAIYKDRLCVATTFTDINTIWVSLKGEPEAINQITGLIINFPNGNPTTNLQELRDVLYAFKRSNTAGFIDNGDEPSTWPGGIIDHAYGTSVHGIATVLDSGSATIDYLLVATLAGVMVFNGKYIEPALTWKIEAFWEGLDREEFRKIQMVFAPIQGWVLIVLPDGRLLMADTNNGFNHKTVRWIPWEWVIKVNCIAIVNIDEIVIGSPVFVP